MSARTLTFQFEELPLVIETGFEAGLVNGSAEISYFPDGEWSIRSIALDGKRLRTPLVLVDNVRALTSPFEDKPVELDAGSPLYLTIYHRLENEWRSKVRDTVSDQILADQVSTLEAGWDHRRKLVVV